MKPILLILSFVCAVHVVFGQAETGFQFSKKFVPIKEQFGDLEKKEYKYFLASNIDLKAYDWKDIEINRGISSSLTYYNLSISNFSNSVLFSIIGLLYVLTDTPLSLDFNNKFNYSIGTLTLLTSVYFTVKFYIDGYKFWKKANKQGQKLKIAFGRYNK